MRWTTHTSQRPSDHTHGRQLSLAGGSGGGAVDLLERLHQEAAQDDGTGEERVASS